MVRPDPRHAADHHVGVAADLDLLQAVFVHQLVEGDVEPVQEPHQVGRGGAAGAFGEPDDIGEQHRGVVVFVGDDVAVGVLQPRGDAARQHVGQQRF